MKQIHLSLLVASGMIAIALLTIIEAVPEEAAQFAPFLLLSLFPGAWMRGANSCNPVKACKP